MADAEMRPRRVAVTGATGFLGRHLCAALGGDYVVRGIGRGHDPVPGAAEWTQLADLAASPDWTAAVRGADVVVHLAARVHRVGEVTPGLDPVYLRENADATESLARAAAAAGVRLLVFASTLAVHGSDSGSGALTETSALVPDLPYGRAKLEAERRLATVAQATGLDVLILRPPLVYGPAAPGNFPRLVRAIARGWPLPFASVRNRRSLLFVGNFTAGVARVLAAAPRGVSAFLLADREAPSTPELIRLIAARLGRPPRLWTCPPPVLELAGRVTGRARTVRQLTGNLAVDASAFGRAFMWEPPYSLAQGIAMSVPGTGDA